MKRFKSILCLVDEEAVADAAFRRALRLAATNDATLTLASVLPAADAFVIGPMGWGDGLYPDPGRIREGIVEERRAGLARLAGEAAQADVAARIRLLEGRYFMEVIRQVVRDGHDLVVKVAHGGSSRLRWFFGSDDHHLMRKCPVPVWLLDPRRTDRFRSVLAAVDVSGRGRDPLDVKIVELASSLARREGARLGVVHAWSLPEERYLRAHESEISHPGLGGVLRAEKAARRERLEGLVRDVAPESDAQVHLRKGDPARMVSLVARETRADLLVMGTLGRSGIPGFLIGNTAEAVLARVRCGVLTVKPHGFRTPVRLETAPFSEGRTAPDRVAGGAGVRRADVPAAPHPAASGDPTRSRRRGPGRASAPGGGSPA